MASPTRRSPLADATNVPNLITSARLVLSIVLFVAMTWRADALALGLFVVTVSTDWIDGFLARRWGQVTVLGRILDPFVDKVCICGTYTLLATVPESRVAGWMAVVILGRELLVTALRSFLEQRGTDFSASWAGKLKMVVQSAAAAGSFALLVWPSDTLATAVVAGLWAAVGLTVWSGAEYVVVATRLVRRDG